MLPYLIHTEVSVLHACYCCKSHLLLLYNNIGYENSVRTLG
jgi:hypothetical protein